MNILIGALMTFVQQNLHYRAISTSTLTVKVTVTDAMSLSRGWKTSLL